MVDFSARLKDLRQQAGLTQKQLGDLIGTSKAAISYYELSERTPSPEMLVKLASVFHVTTDYLLGIERQGQNIDISGLNREEIQVVQHMIDVLRKRK